MIRQALAHYTFVSASCIALFLFLTVFTGILIWIYRKESSSIYQYTSNLPLMDNQEMGGKHE